MNYIIQLETMDDITSIRSRIDFVLAGAMPHVVSGSQREPCRVLLVVPRHNKALRSLVNMKLLGRVARTKSVEIGLVTDQPEVRDYAREVGLKRFSSVRAAKRKGWVLEEALMLMPERTLPPMLTPQQEETPERDAERLTQKQRRRKRYRVVMGRGRIGCVQQAVSVLLMIGLAVLFVVGLVGVLPQAEVTIIPVAQRVETDLVVRGDPTVSTVDFSTLTFPARVAQVELSLFGEIETIETEFAPSGYAAGNVTFINQIDVEQTIPPSTTLTTSSGSQMEFRTLTTATLPAGINSTTRVPVQAQDPGPDGNVGAGQVTRFSDSRYSVSVRVVNEFALGGGTFELARIVVQDDKQRLRDHLIQEMRREGLRELEESLGEQDFVSADTLQVIPLALTFREFSGDFSDTFSGEMQAVVRGTVVGGYNANRLSLAALEAQVPPGFELDSKGLHFGAGEVLGLEEGLVTFRIVASGLAVPVIDPYEVAQDIAWLSVGEAQDLLSQRYELATVPGVDLEPSWLANSLGRLPYLPLRIEVEVQDAVVFLADEER